jgi:hypothetical protein
MATRMQQRRGTASQWTSANPVLNAGEIGWESDTNKFKIGDGTNHWANIDYFADINSTVNPAFGSSITFEGATANDFETTLAVTDPTGDRTITLPDVTGTVITTGNLSDITDIGVFSSTITMEGSTANDFELTLSAGDPTADRTVTFPDATGTVALLTATQTFTNSKLTGSSYDSNIVDPTVIGPLKLEGGSYGVTIASSGDRETFKTWGFGTDGVLTAPGNIIFEGATANDYETTLAITDPTADRTITLPDATGTVQLRVADVDDAEIGYLNGVTSSIQTQMDAKAPAASPTFTGTVVLPSTVNGPSASTSVNLLFPTTSGNITLGGSQTAGNLTIGGGTQRTTGVIGIGTGATTTGTKTIDIGTGSTGGTTQITVGSSSGATSNITLNGTVTAANNLVVTGDLTVNGTTTTINSTTLAVDDKNIILGDVETPTDTTADGGGITLKGATDKTLNWLDATDSWTSSEHLTLNATKELRLADTDSTHYVGFKAPGTVSANKVWILPAADGTAGQALSTDGSGNLSWATSGGGAAFSELMLVGC